MSRVTAFVPCRAGSERVKQKNTRPFAGSRGGLIERKLRQLDASAEIDDILLSTNDPEVIAIAEAVSIAKPLEIHRRDDRLATSMTSTDDVILHAIDLMVRAGKAERWLLWTHVTAPFVDGALYDAAVDALRADPAHDSLMSVSPLRTFIWDDEGAVNYDRAREKWPRTQTLKPLYAVNSAMFICGVELMQARRDRIGEKPLLFELDAFQSTDIDWDEDFVLAEMMALRALEKAG